MSCYAALTTSKSPTAIASIEITGETVFGYIAKIFKPANNSKPDFKPGHFYHGKIYSGDQIIDDVIITVSSADAIAINCHGNPLIVKNILGLLRDIGVKITTSPVILRIKKRDIYKDDTIVIEADQTHLSSKTLDGVKLIMNQTRIGLKKWAAYVLANFEKIPEVKIRYQSLLIYQNSKIASLVINGIKIVITGPPNSGKSTLLNCLAGQSKAIVSDIEGTTRDWVNIQCRIKSYFAEFIDTAGISPELAAGGKIDAQSQIIAEQMIQNADIVLLVLDGTTPPAKWFQHEALWQNILPQDKPLLTVLNKSDIAKKDSGGLWVSALNNVGMDLIVEKILQSLGLTDFDLEQTICFTPRQTEIIKLLTQEKSKDTISILLNKLLNQKLDV